MQNNIFIWIIIILFVSLFGYCVISHNRYLRLEEKYENILQKSENVLDSLNKENELKKTIVLDLEKDVVDLELKIDSLKNRTETIIKNEFEVSSSISVGAKQLRDNLQWNNF